MVLVAVCKCNKFIIGMERRSVCSGLARRDGKWVELFQSRTGRVSYICTWTSLLQICLVTRNGRNTNSRAGGDAPDRQRLYSFVLFW